MTIKDYIRKSSVKLLKHGQPAGTGTVIEEQGQYYVLTAAHVPFGKQFADLGKVTPEDISIQFECGSTALAADFIGNADEWKKYDVLAIRLKDMAILSSLKIFMSDIVETPGLQFVFRGIPIVTGSEFKFYEGFKFDDKNTKEPFRVTIHGDMKYLTDFNGVGGAELNAGVSGSGVFLENHSGPYMVGVITDVPHQGGTFGVFKATLLEPVREVLGAKYENPPIVRSKKTSRVANSPIIYYEDANLKALLAEHEKEKEIDPDYKGFSDELNKFFCKCIKKKIRSLEEKLEDGDRTYLYDYAMDAKEKVTKKIHSLAFYKSAQDVYTYLLANIRVAFLHEVQSKIKSGQFESYQIDEIVKNNIIGPYIQNLGGSSLRISEDELYGILYFLTGNCYIEWD